MEPNSSKRDRIVAQIEPVFLELGFRRMTTDAIAEHLGISKKTLYQEFPSKKELVRAVVHSKMARIEATLKGIAERASAERASGERASGERASVELDAVDPIGAHFLNLSRELYGLGKPFIVDLMKHDPELWDEISAFRRHQILSRVQRLVVLGQQNGFVQSWVVPSLIAEVVIAIADTLLVPSKVVELDVPMGELIRHIGAVLTSGLLTDAGRDARRSFWTDPRSATDEKE